MREDTLRKIVSLFFQYLWLVFGVLMCVNLLSLFFTTTNILESSTKEKLASLSGELAIVVDNNYKLLQGITSLPNMDNTAILVEDRAWTLRPFAESFGVWMIGVVDPDGHIAGTRSYGSAVVQRDYIPRIVASKQREMTNAFPSGETGELNFTQLVPIVRKGKVVSIVFVATLLSDLKAKLARSDANTAGSYSLVDSSLTIGVHPNPDMEMKSLLAVVQSELVLGTMSREELLEECRAGKTNSYYSFHNNILFFTAYTLVPGTTWRLAHRVQLSKVFETALAGFVVQALLYSLLLAALMFVWHRYMQQALAPVDNILKQVIDLNRIVHNSDTCTDEDAASLLYISRHGLRDELTDLPTRMLFRQMLNERLKKLETSTVCAVYYLDMDNLKRINDTLGHECGDAALKAFGHAVKQAGAKYNGLCARYGGDEFILFVANLKSEAEAKILAENLLVTLYGSVERDGTRMDYHSSIGIAMYPLHGTQIDVVIQLADIALYEAKQNGKNTVVVYSSQAS